MTALVHTAPKVVGDATVCRYIEQAVFAPPVVTAARDDEAWKARSLDTEVES